MLRIHFTEVDLARTTLAVDPDPLWEIAASLHRLQTRRGRWAFAQWHHEARHTLRERGLERAVRALLVPLYPTGGYFPDFLTPEQAADGLEGGLSAILDEHPGRITAEIRRLARTAESPRSPRAPRPSRLSPWTAQLPCAQGRQELVGLLRAYHSAAIAPHGERMRARIEAERATCSRALMTGGVEGMLAGLGPTMRWENPVLHVTYPVADRDLHLNGRGLRLVPSYFSWGTPVSLADPGLRPVLCYPVLKEPARTAPSTTALAAQGCAPGKSLTALLGPARAGVLSTAAGGATTGEIARVIGVSASSASRHATVLRDAGLITTSRNGASVLHTLTPAGASVLRAAAPR
ncbi:ArsR/SmtB family transcription factor [Streptomyces caeruleatus]|uniref:ArsR family transcriptional regulator n=1 Tax=Streptomyces caeruleatus TaxID=661399 RepID=A0A124I8D4_9ACTN|nr:helix-turn-helix domain-containing protein [Streptomyces caeruleatus]KUN99044.1 ArsR family transcriptional regulator [Streptomyces caeruleatus]